jgi:hypothetical protein
LVELEGSVEGATRGPSSRHESRLEARIVDKATGAVRLSTLTTGSPWLRGEFHGNGTIDGRIYPLDVRHYVVRIPAEKSATLELSGLDAEPAAGSLAVPQRLVIDLDQRKRQRSSPPEPPRCQPVGPPARFSPTDPPPIASTC